MQFGEWKGFFLLKSTEVCSQSVNWNIGSENGLAPNRRQTIIWTHADPIHLRMYVALEGDLLTSASCSPRAGSPLQLR